MVISNGTRDQDEVLSKDVYVSNHTNRFRKDMNLSVLPTPSMGKLLGRLSYLALVRQPV